MKNSEYSVYLTRGVNPFQVLIRRGSIIGFRRKSCNVWLGANKNIPKIIAWRFERWLSKEEEVALRLKGFFE